MGAGTEIGLGGRRRALLAPSVALVLIASLAAVAVAASLDFFQPASSPEEAGDDPFSVAVADLDGDGDQDLAVANQVTPGTVTILKNRGSGNFFEPPSSPEVIGGPNPAYVAAADLDGDSDQDLALVTFANVAVLENRGSGNFFEPPSSPEPVRGPGSPDLTKLAIADLDGDSDQDLAVIQGNNGLLDVLKNNGAGNFVEPPSSPEQVVGNAEAIAAADLDGDGDSDLAAGSSNSGQVTILQNNGVGNFLEPPSSPETGVRPKALVAADLDGDGDQDLASADGHPLDVSHDVSILKNHGAGNFFEPASSPETAAQNPRSIAAADFDADGDPDLAVLANGERRVTILGNRGRGNFVEPETSPFPAGANPLSIAAGDLDGDTDPDLAVANAGHTVTIFLNH